MAATIGLGLRSMTSCTWESVGSCGGLPNSGMSAPAMNGRPAHAMTIAAAPASPAASVIAARTHVVTERVDGRIVHGHARDPALTIEADGLADLRHASLVWRRSGANDTRPAPALLR